MGFPRRVFRGGRTVRLSFLLRAARNHRRIGRLAQNDLRLGPFLCEHARDALERPSGAEAGYEIVQSRALEIRENLFRRSARVYVSIGFVLELACQVPSVGLG